MANDKGIVHSLGMYSELAFWDYFPSVTLWQDELLAQFAEQFSDRAFCCSEVLYDYIPCANPSASSKNLYCAKGLEVWYLQLQSPQFAQLERLYTHKPLPRALCEFTLVWLLSSPSLNHIIKRTVARSNRTNSPMFDTTPHLGLYARPQIYKESPHLIRDLHLVSHQVDLVKQGWQPVPHAAHNWMITYSKFPSSSTAMAVCIAWQ